MAPVVPPGRRHATALHKRAVGADVIREAHLALIREKCKRGDTVSLPGDNASMVARFCDFSRTIILKGRDPDSYIGSQLKEAGRWPPEGKLKASSALPR
jgi:hypothetical protein